MNLAEIADGSRLFASRRHLLQSALPCIRSEGNRRGRPRRNTVSGGTAKEDENQKIFKSSDGKSSDSSNQEEIIALFRRIQSSISKGGHGKIKKRNSNSSEEKQSADSVLEVLRQSKKQVKKGYVDKCYFLYLFNLFFIYLVIYLFDLSFIAPGSC